MHYCSISGCSEQNAKELPLGTFGDVTLTHEGSAVITKQEDKTIHVPIKNTMHVYDHYCSPTELVSGHPDNFSDMKTFGCRVWVRPPGGRRAKLLPNARAGRFLGFLPGTTRNAMWYDEITQRVKIAKHLRFDEGMSDLPVDALPPNVQHLTRVNNGDRLAAGLTDTDVADFAFTLDPFIDKVTHSIPVKCTQRSLGIDIGADEFNNRAFITRITKNSSFGKAFPCKSSKASVRYSWILAIDDTDDDVFTADQARQAIAVGSKDIRLILCVDKQDSAKLKRFKAAEHADFDIFDAAHADDDHVPSISPEDILHIAAIRFQDRLDSVSPHLAQVAIHALSSMTITPAEQALGVFTRRKLRGLDNWTHWEQGELKQLD
jgi:hypothetical protein